MKTLNSKKEVFNKLKCVAIYLLTTEDYNRYHFFGNHLQEQKQPWKVFLKISEYKDWI